jgi:RNA polymerase sigma-70 factor (ECF subfamily)
MAEALSAERIKLVKRAQRGDARAFAALFKGYRQPVHNFARQLLYDKDKVEDVVQDVSVKVYKNLGLLREPGAFKTWVYRICAMTCRDYNRKTGREQREQRIEDVDVDAEAAAAVATTPVQPAERYDAQERSKRMAAAVDGLPDAQRSALYLRYFEELSYKEIAEIMGTPIGTVMSRLNRARAALRQQLSSYAADLGIGNGDGESS